jgi:two-component system NarL family sensor kinase
MSIRDYGKGLPQFLVENFASQGSSGVGLAGMRGRVSDLNGTLNVESAAPGTLVRASLPLPAFSTPSPSSQPPAPAPPQTRQIKKNDSAVQASLNLSAEAPEL